MGWQAYDPKAPPKVGQKARCANFGEMILPATGTGAALTRGISFAELVNKDWEIFWEPTKLPPIGSTFEVAPCAYAMVGSIGKIVSHTGYGGAIVEWITKATKEEHPTDWSFPNYNVRVLETPAPDQAKVGDLFREVGTGAVVRINASDGGKCAAEVLFSGNSGYTRGEIRHGFGSTIIDDSWNHWKRVVPPKVGEVYRTHDKHATHQSAIEITEIIDHRVSAKILETTSIWKVGSDHSDFIHLEHGCMPAHWLPVKTPVKEPKVKAEVGQVYSNNGWVVRIVGVKGEGCSAETLEPGNSGWKVGHVHSFWGSLKKDGTLVADYWKLVENHTPQPKFQVGQVWKNPLSGNWTVQITKIRSDGIAEGTTLEQGTSGFKVGYQHNALVGEKETKGWELIENYVPAVDLLSKKVEVGQVWKSNSGWTVRIVRIKGVWTEGETLARPDVPSEIGKISTWKAIDSSGQFEIPGDWVQQENYVVKKEDSEAKNKIKVGQIWTYHNGFQVQVHRIDGIHVSIRVLKRGGSDYKVGETDTNYETLDKDGYAGYHLSGKNWSLTQEAAHMPAKVGEVYDMGGWKVKITKIALGGMVSAKTLEGTGLTYRPGTIHDNLCYADSNGRMPPYWELMEMTDQSPPEKPMHKVRVGQVWTFATGCVVKITKIGDKHASAHVVKRGASVWRDGEDVEVFAVIYGDGAIDPGGSWALTTEAPITLEERSLPKVGQVYRRNNDVVKITKVPPTPGRVDVDMVKGDSGWKYLSTYGNGKMNIDWELIEEPIENKSSVQVGQLWKRPDGWTVKITEVNGIGVKSECVESGTSVHKTGTTYTWSEWLVDKNMPPTGWQRTDNVEQTMKVGQVWAESAPRNCKVQIVGIENGYAQVVMLRSGTSGYPEGHRHNSWFLLRSKYDTWKLEMDVPEYGDRVEVEISGKVIQGTYLGDVGGERNVVHLDEKYDSGSSASWSAGADKKLEGLKLKVGRFCWSVVEGQSKITKVVKKENGNMSNEKKDTQDKESFGSMFKADMTDAAWRAGATGMTTAVKTAILAMLKDKGADDGRLSMAKELMESEFGSIMVRALIGYGLTYAPMVSEDPRAQKLAKEFRVSAMNGGMDQVMGIGFEYLLPAVQGALKALPPISEAVPEMLRSKPKHRVAPADDAADEDEEEMEEEKTSAANAG